MRKFDRLEHSKQFVSNPGSKFHEVKHGEVQADGTIKLVVDQLEDTDAVIDSYRESTEIYNLIARIEAGDVELLNRVSGFYGDVTEMPKNYAEMLNLIHKGEDIFNKLPVEIKQKFNNDFNQFFAAMDSPDFMKMFQTDDVSGIVKVANQTEVKEPEVKEE